MANSSLRIDLWRVRTMAQRVWYSVRDKFVVQSVDHGVLEQKIKNRVGPVRVAFLVCSPSKWSAQALFETLQDDPDFDPFFILTISDVAVRARQAQRRQEYASAQEFFTRIGRISSSLYDPDHDRMFEATDLQADLIFIQQPWGMQSLPRQVRGTHLTAYVHYGFPVIQNDRMQFGLPHFHPYLWCHYLPSEVHAKDMRSKPVNKSHRTFVAGYPKLDVYLTPSPQRDAVKAWPNASDVRRKRVIFAPHHTILSKSLALGTFDWSGPVIAEFARVNPEIDFLFRPHPNLESEIDRAGSNMRDLYLRFRHAWDQMENCDFFEAGGYYDVFRSSDVMVTDCGSFLAEYLPTGNPLIRLVTEDGIPLNAAGKAIADGFYSVGDTSALASVLDTVVVQGLDDLRDTRARCIRDVLPKQMSSLNIIDHLRRNLRAPRLTE